ncbi:MAG TPA: potassium transporter TrkG [Candidatus Anammoximicrobium sp.]|nr:potassium transporter TrkG [Candidatus Anammoximicrobium sp.]
MNLRLTLRVQGGLLIFLAAMLLTPVPFSLAHPRAGAWHDGAFWAFLLASLIALAVGLALYRRFRTDDEMTYREGFAIVTFGWISYALFGGLPYLLAEVNGIRGFADAFFEAMSGFSTTGSTVITGLERVPPSILFWRAMTQWLGGMGIIVLSLAILPFLGVGGMQLFEAESPGPTKDRLSPRIQDTAKVLWGVYAILTLTEALLLWAGGMTAFESLCHAFTTMATGGFSTRDASIAAFGGYTHVVIGMFMLLAGVNFSLHFHTLRGRPGRYWQSEEFRFYLALIASSTAVITVLIVLQRDLPGHALVKFRDAAFQTVSMMTTTGYATADFETWPAMAQYLLVALMFVGGCAASTGGSIKVVRILLLSKHAFLQLSRLIHPREVRSLKLDHKPVSREVIQSVLGFFALFVAIFLLGSLLMAGILPPGADGAPDLVTAGTAVISALGNIGPGLGTVGPTETYTHLPAAGKLVLAACMLVGRLEVFTVLVLFFPSFWRK